MLSRPEVNADMDVLAPTISEFVAEAPEEILFGEQRYSVQQFVTDVLPGITIAQARRLPHSQPEPFTLPINPSSPPSYQLSRSLEDQCVRRLLELEQAGEQVRDRFLASERGQDAWRNNQASYVQILAERMCQVCQDQLLQRHNKLTVFHRQSHHHEPTVNQTLLVGLEQALISAFGQRPDEFSSDADAREYVYAKIFGSVVTPLATRLHNRFGATPVDFSIIANDNQGQAAKDGYDIDSIAVTLRLKIPVGTGH